MGSVHYVNGVHFHYSYGVHHGYGVECEFGVYDLNGGSQCSYVELWIKSKMTQQEQEEGENVEPITDGFAFNNVINHSTSTGWHSKASPMKDT